MFIELVDALRCPRTHEESWLVLAATRTEARHVQEGTLGCPVCHAEYPIHEGIADLRLDPPPDGAERGLSAHDGADPIHDVSAGDLAALLDLGDALGFVVLVGAWSRRAAGLLELEVVPPLLVVDPPDGVRIVPGVSGVRSGATLPLAAGAARAVAVDDVGAVRVESAARATRTGGRIVAPALAGVPEGVRELARSDSVWVGEREAAPSALVRLHVRRG
jgi:uncharacterized protein YbaR (Trm112 family)